MAADVSLAWDAGVSSVHGDLQRMADNWVLVDEGLSRNGSFVKDERIAGRGACSTATSCASAGPRSTSTRRSR